MVKLFVTDSKTIVPHVPEDQPLTFLLEDERDRKKFYFHTDSVRKGLGRIRKSFPFECKRSCQLSEFSEGPLAPFTPIVLLELNLI